MKNFHQKLIHISGSSEVGFWVVMVSFDIIMPQEGRLKIWLGFWPFQRHFSKLLSVATIGDI